MSGIAKCGGGEGEMSEMEDDILARLDAQSERQTELGIDGARGCWHALSDAQRRVLTLLGDGRWLAYAPASRTRFDALGEPHGLSNVCGAPTLRNLMARELVVWASPRKAVITERGRFVLKHGPSETRWP